MPNLGIMTDDKLFIKCMEEAAEFQHAVAKMALWGPDSFNPYDKITNREKLSREAGDLIAFMNILIKRGLINQDIAAEQTEKKFNAFSD